MTTTDAFLCTGSTNYDGGADLTGLNFGAAGTLAIAPASSASGEFQSVIKFNLADGVAQFNSAYGSNHWSITGVTLDLTSNYGTAGATRTANPALDKTPEAPPEKMSIHFVGAEVVVLGSGLKRLERWLQGHELLRLATGRLRYLALGRSGFATRNDSAYPQQNCAPKFKACHCAHPSDFAGYAGSNAAESTH